MQMRQVDGVVASAFASGDEAIITIFPIVADPHRRLDPAAAIVMGRTRPAWQERDGHHDYVVHLVGCAGTISYADNDDRPMFEGIQRN